MKRILERAQARLLKPVDDGVDSEAEDPMSDNSCNADCTIFAARASTSSSISETVPPPLLTTKSPSLPRSGEEKRAENVSRDGLADHLERRLTRLH